MNELWGDLGFRVFLVAFPVFCGLILWGLLFGFAGLDFFSKEARVTRAFERAGSLAELEAIRQKFDWSADDFWYQWARARVIRPEFEKARSLAELEAIRQRHHVSTGAFHYQQVREAFIRPEFEKAGSLAELEATRQRLGVPADKPLYLNARERFIRPEFEKACPGYECSQAELEATRQRLGVSTEHPVYREWLAEVNARAVLRDARPSGGGVR